MRPALLHIVLLIAVVLVSCDKAPRGVIGERKMAELVEDFLKADAYMDMHRDVYGTDSMRQLMKQSIMRKHGVTQELYDTSLVWYAHNMDAYTRQVGFLPADESIVNIWDKDARYSRIIETMKTGKSFPNIPEWVAIEGILIEFSNALGDLFREGSSREAVEDQAVELFWDAHQKINKSLGYADTLDKARAVSHIKRLLFASVEEVTPESMTVVVEEEGGSIWVFVLVVVIAAVAAIAGMALSALVRKK